MASSQPLPAAFSSGDLPRDALVEILLRIPSKDLCRFRAVSPSWRALTCDPLFIAEHKSRHTAPLLAVAYRDQDMANGVDVVDFSSSIVRRIPSIESDIVAKDESGHVFALIPSSRDSISVLRTRLDLIGLGFRDHEDFCYGHLNLQLSLAELDGSLVTVHNNHYICMDLWFLTDFENATWEKKYNIPSHVAQLFVYPFLVLHDGRILFSHGEGFLKSYDPKTGTYANALEVRDSRSIGIYTGSLLSL